VGGEELWEVRVCNFVVKWKINWRPAENCLVTLVLAIMTVGTL